MKLSEKIRILRKARGLSQEELGFELNNASDFGVSRQSISDWENGRSEPKLENIKLLAKALNVSCDTLLDDEIELNNEGNIITEKENNIDNFSYRRTIKTLHYEYKSKKTIGNIPLIHINLGIGFYKAKGIIAIGNISMGVNFNWININRFIIFRLTCNWFISIRLFIYWLSYSNRCY